MLDEAFGEMLLQRDLFEIQTIMEAKLMHLL